MISFEFISRFLKAKSKLNFFGLYWINCNDKIILSIKLYIIRKNKSKIINAFLFNLILSGVYFSVEFYLTTMGLAFFLIIFKIKLLTFSFKCVAWKQIRGKFKPKFLFLTKIEWLSLFVKVCSYIWINWKQQQPFTSELQIENTFLFFKVNYRFSLNFSFF